VERATSRSIGCLLSRIFLYVEFVPPFPPEGAIHARHERELFGILGSMKRPDPSAVPNPTCFPSSHNEEPTRYVSFILRCWTGEEGQLRARLIDVRTDVGHIVGSLALLPDLVRRLMTNAPPTDAETHAEVSPCLDQIDSQDER
jgi:hypothetical protein